jgi:hypothetical protein
MAILITHATQSGDASPNISGPEWDADHVVTGAVEGDGITKIVKLTQAEYDALGTPDAETLYVIVD